MALLLAAAPAAAQDRPTARDLERLAEEAPGAELVERLGALEAEGLNLRALFWQDPEALSWPLAEALRRVLRLDHERMELDRLVATAAMLRNEFGAAERHLGQARAALATFESSYAGAAQAEAWLENERIETDLVRLQLELERGLIDRARPIYLRLRGRLAEGALGDPATASDRASRAVLGIARFHLAEDDYQRLEEHLRKALEGGRIVARERPLAEYWIGLALSELGSADPEGLERARERLTSALELTPPEWGLLRSQIELRLGRVALAAGDLAEAERRIERARALQQSAHSDRLAIEAAHLAVFRLRLAQRSRRGVEEARAELLEHWETLLETWRRLPARSGGVGFLHFRNPNRVLSDVLLERVQEPGGARAALGELLAAEACTTLVQRLAGGPERVDLARLEAALLEPAGGAWVYLATHEGTHAFFLRGGGEVEHRFLPATRVGLRRGIRAWQGRLRLAPQDDPHRASRPEDLARMSRELWEQLVPSEWHVAAEGLTHLYIVGADLLENLPFEHLGPGEPAASLGHSSALAHLPSLTLGTLLAERAQARGVEPEGLILVLGGDDPRGELELLRFSDRQLAPLLRPLRPATRIDPPQATPAALNALPPAGVLTFLGHGRLDLERERPATLIVGDGEGVGCEEVEAWESVPPHVLLLACSVGLGPARPGDGGIGHLAGSLLLGGADCTLLPASDVEAHSTVAFGAAYLEGLAAGRPAALAAREARRALAGDPRFVDPYYHGSLSVVGLAHRSPALAGGGDAAGTAARAPAERGPMPGSWAWVAGLAGAVLLVLAALSARRRS